MRLIALVLTGCASFLLVDANFAAAQPANATHRAILLDSTKPKVFNAPYRLSLLDMDNRDIIAEKIIGSDPDVTFSPDGSLIAAIFKDPQRADRLQIYHTDDLSIVADGTLPFQDRDTASMRVCGFNVIAFGDGDAVVVVPRHPSPDEYQFESKWTAVEWKGERALRGGSFTESNRWKTVGSSRVDLQACKLEYSIVSPK